MNIFESIILGLVQGITEFIPVSSSGHLEIAECIISPTRAEDFHFFLEFINIGTLLALFIFFRKRIYNILKDIFVHKNYKLGLNLIITTIPAGIAGFLFADFIENVPFFSSMITISAMIAAVGVLMILADKNKLPHLTHLKDEDHLTKKRALAIGLAQTFALVPGTSRSGSTIVAGRMVGLSSASAAEYSFLASIPVITGVCLKTFISSASRAYFNANLGVLALSNAVAFATGLLALQIVLKYLKKPGSLAKFGTYRVILGCSVLILALIA